MIWINLCKSLIELNCKSLPIISISLCTRYPIFEHFLLDVCTPLQVLKMLLVITCDYKLYRFCSPCFSILDVNGVLLILLDLIRKVFHFLKKLHHFSHLKSFFKIIMWPQFLIICILLYFVSFTLILHPF